MSARVHLLLTAESHGAVSLSNGKSPVSDNSVQNPAGTLISVDPGLEDRASSHWSHPALYQADNVDGS